MRRLRRLAHDAGEALTFLECPGGAGGEGFDFLNLFFCPAREEGEGFLEEQVGGSDHPLARALAVERPHKSGVAARPIFGAHFIHDPFSHE